MTTQNLIIELGTEELPPKALKKLASAFADSFARDIAAAGLPCGEIKWYAAPRRLAVSIKDLEERQPDQIVEKKGPAVAAAFKDGQPTKAAIGWASSNGITVDQAERFKTDKGEWLLFRAEVKGKSAVDLIPAMIENAAKALPVPKLMHWGATKYEFVRPVHTLLALYGSTLIDATVLGVKSSKTIRGHRFMGKQELVIDHADEYLSKLEQEGSVMADYDKRRSVIAKSVTDQATKLGGKADLDESLLDEVTSLVEWPVVLTAKFDEKFLRVPSEALVYTMKGDQKYFPVYDSEGKLLPNFIFISNIDSLDASQVIAGNERVVRPRLSDAEFFFDTDRKTRLESRLPSLDTVLFQKQLGTLGERAKRISELSGFIATKIGADEAKAKRAGLLSKCDLMTNMVMEFTDTQGVMGMHYARLDGEGDDIADALFEQYLPRFAGDKIPNAGISVSVSLADKLDTLTGIFGIGQPPKGDKDPFGLRRATIGVLRVITENKLDLDLLELLEKSASLHGNHLTNKNVVNDVFEYSLARFKAMYQDEGVSAGAVASVLVRKPTRPYDLSKRVRAIVEFSKNEAAEALGAANKRVSNILAKAGDDIPESINEAIMSEEAERALATSVAAAKSDVEPMFSRGEYDSALTRLSAIRSDVDAFFDKVMVMAEDPKVRGNRLALLRDLRGLFLGVADISYL